MEQAATSAATATNGRLDALHKPTAGSPPAPSPDLKKQPPPPTSIQATQTTIIRPKSSPVIATLANTPSPEIHPQQPPPTLSIGSTTTRTTTSTSTSTTTTTTTNSNTTETTAKVTPAATSTSLAPSTTNLNTRPKSAAASTDASGLTAISVANAISSLTPSISAPTCPSASNNLSAAMATSLATAEHNDTADRLEGAIVSSLLKNSGATRTQAIRELLPQFSDQLKTHFEDKTLWLKFSLCLTLSRQSPQSALQAFHECLRIEPKDPLPAMLAAKLLLQELDQPEDSLELARIATERCQNLNQAHLLSRCYLLASIANAHIYEREPESIRQQFKIANLKASLNYLDLALETNPDDYLIYFHRALHDARLKSYNSAIDNVRQAIKLNPNHLESVQLMVLILSALKMHDAALLLCNSALFEFDNDMLLLKIKCNLESESNSVELALNTAQHILRCIRANKAPDDQAALTTNLFADGMEQRPQFGEPSAWLLAAEVFIKIGSLQDADHCVEEAAKVTGVLSHEILLVRGLIAKSRNKLAEAKCFLQSCLALRPRHAHALQQIAHVHYLLGTYSIAEKFLRDSLDIDSDCHKTWYYMSQVLIETNQHDKASECIKKARVLEESSPIISISAIPRLTLE